MSDDQTRCERRMWVTGEPCTWPASFRVGARKHDSELCCTRHLAQAVSAFIGADDRPVLVDTARGSSA